MAHIVCDPVHGIMEFDTDTKNAIKPIVDSRFFQRLRHIKQLSFAEYAYPGAVHTRFNHCIGAAYLAQCVANTLEFDPTTKISAIVTGLLHDIGHGPFSHAFEGLYGEGKKINHEAWNGKFIEELKPLIGGELHIYLDKAKFILESKEAGIIEHTDKLLKQIVSSQLDVDRFDYLLRDSHFAGVSYGHFDVHWLISCMRKNDGKIVVEPKGVRAVEHYLMARRLMNLNVYFHKKKCSAEYLLKVLFTLCEEKLDEIKKDINSSFLDFIKMVKENKMKSDFEQIMLKDGFGLYLQLTDHTVWDLISRMQNLTDPNIKEISSRFLERNLPITLEVKPGKGAYVKQKIDESKKGCSEEWRIYYDNPQLSFYKTKAEEIYVNECNDAGSADQPKPYTNVLSYSTVLSLFSDKSENFDFVHFIDNGLASAHLVNMRKLILELGEENCLTLSAAVKSQLSKMPK